jgi:hypothetical protein
MVKIMRRPAGTGTVEKMQRRNGLIIIGIKSGGIYETKRPI